MFKCYGDTATDYYDNLKEKLTLENLDRETNEGKIPSKRKILLATLESIKGGWETTEQPDPNNPFYVSVIKDVEEKKKL